MDYQLEQTGQQVQSILNQAPTTEQDLRSEIVRSTNKDEQLETAIGNEKTRAEGVESNLQTAIGNEKTRAEGAESNLQTAIGNEKIRAELVEGALRTDVDGINSKIPSGATSENKLATQSFVNSSVATATADFKGTYDSLEALETAVHDANANDYAFVISTDAAGNTVYNRYKYVEGTGWVFEYALNNSSFTEAQWAAINSAITAALVAKLTGLPTATELTTQLNAIIDSVATEKSRAEGIESGLRTDVNANATAIGTEKTRAEGAEGNLSTAIGNEKTRAEGAELVLQQNINAEALLRSNADTALQTSIDGINAKIPAAASASNQLADKTFVNSSIATNTATFKGTYNSLADLEATVHDADNNDYAFIVSTDTAGNTIYNRYKYVTGTGWVFEYALNNSSFTADQWAAIQSGITAALVSKLSALPNNTDLTAMFTAITELIPSAATTSNQLADKAYVLAQILEAIPAFKGTYETLAALEAVQSPKDGDIGIVLTMADDGLLTYGFYQYLNNDWNPYYTLTQRPKDKPATTGETGDYPYNGMGRVVLQKNIVSNVNTLTQDMFYKGEVGSRVPNINTVFVIQYDFVLGSDITVPENCILEFDGGSISGAYNITGNSTGILAGLVKIFNSNVNLVGSWNVSSLYPEWFGAIGDGSVNDLDALQKTITMASTSYTSIYEVILTRNKTYCISSAIDLPPYVCICANKISRDKSYKQKNKPRIVVTTNSDAIHLVTETGLGDAIGKNVLYDIALIGNSPLGNKAISYDGNTANYIEKCRFSGLYISNFKFGIYINADTVQQGVNPTFDNNVIEDLSIQKNVGIGIYIKIHDIYDLLIKDSHIYYPYIGGVLIDTTVITTPISFMNCCIEGCGYGYNISDYNIYGCFAISVKSSSETESVNIDKCYFEANAPLKPYDSEYILSSKEAIYPTSNPTYIYINDPDWDKTASVIIEGGQFNVANNVFSEFYQIININNIGKLVFADNIIYVQQLAKNLGMFTKDIVRIKDTANQCKNIAVDINMSNMASTFYSKNNDFGELNDIKLASGTSSSKINTVVKIPLLNKDYIYSWKNDKLARCSNIIYFDSSAEDGGNGMSYAPIKYFDTLLNTITGRYKKGETVTVILRSEVNINQYVSNKNIPQGINIIFKSENAPVTLTLSSVLNCFASSVSFNGINIVKGNGSITSNSCKVNFKNCQITYNAAGQELINCKGDNVVTVDDCTFTLADNSEPHYLDFATYGNVDTIFNNTTVPSNLFYYIMSARKYGTLSQKPDGEHLRIGTSYFATDLNTNGGNIWWNGTAWVDATGATV